MRANFCPDCGAPRTPGARFCGGCGVAVSDRAPAADAPRASAPVTMPTTGWHVAVGDALPTFAPAASQREGASSVMAEPAARPSLRGATFQLLIVSAGDLAAAYATGEPAALKLATMRAALAAVTVLSGLIAGRSRGVFSRITMLSSLVLAAVQSPSLYSFGTRVIANPQLLSGLLPNVVTQSMSFLAAIRTALLARK